MSEYDDQKISEEYKLAYHQELASNQDYLNLFDTESKKRNYFLAYDRGVQYKSHFDFLNSDQTQIKAYHSPYLENAAHRQRNCPNRRMVSINFDLNSQLDKRDVMGLISPPIRVAQGSKGKELILSTAFDAFSMDNLDNLPKECRGDSSREFFEKAKKNIKMIVNNINLILGLSKFEKVFEEVDKSYKFKKCQYEPINCSDILASIKIAFKEFEEVFLKPFNNKNLSKEQYQTLYNFLIIFKQKRHLRYLCSIADEDCGNFSNVILDATLNLLNLKFNDVEKQSTHYYSCFSTKYFYQKENIDDYIIKLDKVVDSNLQFKLSTHFQEKLLIDQYNNETSLLCEKCHNGIELKDDGRYHYKHRSHDKLLGEKEPRRKEAVTIFDYFNPQVSNPNKTTANQDGFLFGDHNTFVFYLVDKCEMEKFPQNAQKMNFDGLKDQIITINSKLDCLFFPLITHTCVNNHSTEIPSTKTNAYPYIEVPSLMKGNNLYLPLRNGMADVNELLEDINQLYCVENQPVNKSDQFIQNQIMCESKSIQIPNEGFESEIDCGQ
jgi:hypothetical protein